MERGPSTGLRTPDRSPRQAGPSTALRAGESGRFDRLRTGWHRLVLADEIQHVSNKMSGRRADRKKHGRHRGRDLLRLRPPSDPGNGRGGKGRAT
jgi:hypothetical protein